MEQEYIIEYKPVPEVEVGDQIQVGGYIYDVVGVEEVGDSADVYLFTVECYSSTEGEDQIYLDGDENVAQVFS